jgi:hypothetical protein
VTPGSRPARLRPKSGDRRRWGVGERWGKHRSSPRARFGRLEGALEGPAGELSSARCRPPRRRAIPVRWGRGWAMRGRGGFHGVQGGVGSWDGDGMEGKSKLIAQPPWWPAAGMEQWGRGSVRGGKRAAAPLRERASRSTENGQRGQARTTAGTAAGRRAVQGVRRRAVRGTGRGSADSEDSLGVRATSGWSGRIGRARAARVPRHGGGGRGVAPAARRPRALELQSAPVQNEFSPKNELKCTRQ